MFMLVLTAALLAVVNATDWHATAQRIRRALQLADIPVKTACADMGLDRSQFEQGLNGDGHLSMKRLSCLPEAFHQWYAVLLAKDYGMPGEYQPARRLQDASALHAMEGRN